ncbi:wee1-like protein kinase [Carex littledalei]|uniref:Wee1-like protein kinase n=1 Tax=Carex littledalei TaxID=544730 RepID=A0A833RLP3_9POAL|nr:wee1-like protein kinase [Carex littledalei]
MKGKTPKSKARGRGRGRGRTTGAADPSSSSHPVAMGTSDLTAQLEGVTLLRPSTRFQKLLETSCLPEPEEQQQQLQERDFILSQDFFCTPDYITPYAPQFTSCLEFDKENVCPKSPEKSTVARSKRYKRVGTRTKYYIGQPIVTNAAVHAVVEE